MSLRRTLLAMLLSIAAVIALASAATSSANADGTPAPVAPPAPPGCSAAGFSTADKHGPETPGGGMVLSVDPIIGFRAGRHDPCFDRAVVDVKGLVGGWNVRFVDEVTADPRGDILEVPGQVRLLVVVGNPLRERAPFPRTGQALIPTKRFASWAEFRSVIFAGSFESVTSVGLGLDEPRGFRVFALPPGPGHTRVGMLVIDVLH